jgi:hypothetical protein
MQVNISRTAQGQILRRHRRLLKAARAFAAVAVYGPLTPTIAAAAAACSSSRPHVNAALKLTRKGNEALISDVLRGRASLLQAAARVGS